MAASNATQCAAKNCNVAIRDTLQDIKPYESFNKSIPVRLNTNENPYSIHEHIAGDIASAVHDVILRANRYPNNEYNELRTALTAHIYKMDNIQFDASQIIAANGSNEVMDEIFRAFGGPDRIALTFSPTYSMYPQYARDSFTKLVQIPRNYDDFSIDVSTATEAIKLHRPSLIIVTNPNNPTGNLTPVSDIESILQCTQDIAASGTSIKNARPVVIIDEAYIDFKPDDIKTCAHLIEKYDNLLIVRTLSKAFSLAGVRIGYAFGDKRLIDALSTVRLPYNLSTITQVIGTKALSYRDEILHSVDEIKATRNLLQTWLTNLEIAEKKLHVVPSVANFILVGFPVDCFPNAYEIPAHLHDFLIARNVQIRIVGPKGYFRVTIGTPDEVEIFKREFAAFCERL